MPKQVGCVVTVIDYPTEIVTFQGGEIVRNRKGREVPRWTVQTKIQNLRWDADSGMWCVGFGPRPRTANGIVLLPDTVYITGSARGSFASKEK